MNKYLLPSFLALILFLLLVSLLDNILIIPKTISIGLTARVSEDDTFQVFYLQQGMGSFIEEKSVRIDVTGSAHLQRINFEIPTDDPIKRIRIDLGQNKYQKPMVLGPVIVKISNQRFDYDVIGAFILNKWVTHKQNVLRQKLFLVDMTLLYNLI
jgi:hypothetical protein